MSRRPLWEIVFLLVVSIMTVIMSILIITGCLVVNTKESTKLSLPSEYLGYILLAISLLSTVKSIYEINKKIKQIKQ